MKKTLFIGILATIAAASCTVKMEQDFAPVSEGTKVTLNVEGNLWADDATKTAYTPGTGVALTGTEKIGLFYYKNDKLNNGYIAATPTSTSGEYTFTMPAEAADAASWYGFMPFSKGLAYLNSAGTNAVVRLGTVQFPEANSFDPHCDYMAVKPFTVEGADGSKTATVNAFKRLFAPLCVSVSGLPEGSKVYTATLSFSQVADKDHTLTGLYYVSLKDTYADTKVLYAEKTSVSNAVTAEYASGLAAISGSWPVWYMVNPTTFTSGATLTMTVSTQDKTYTRTVTLPSDKSLSADTLNKISFNMGGAGTSSVSSITQDFTENILVTPGKDLTASDGNTYNWVTDAAREFRSASDDGGSGLKSALRLCKASGESFTFPTIAGKNIVGAKIYTHPNSRNYASAEVSLTVDGTDKYNFNQAATTASESIVYKGGVIDVVLPAGKTSLAGLTVKSAATQVHLISAITLIVEDAGTPAIDPNDYYAQFMAGEDIVIGGEVFNKTLYPVTPRLVKLYELTKADDLQLDATTKGILFLDYDPADGKEDVYCPVYNLKPQGTTVIIGRYKNHQPFIDMISQASGNISWSPIGNKVVFKNIKTNSKNYMFMTGNATENVSVSLEDCTIDEQSYYVFAESKKGICFESIKIDNCVINSVRALIGYTSAYSAGDEIGTGLISMTNSVFYGKSLISYPTIALKVSSTGYLVTPNLDVNFDHCTLYNVNNNNLGIYSLHIAKKINYNYCVSEAALTNNSPIVMLTAVLDPKITDSTVKGNYGNNSASNTKVWAYGYSTSGNSGVVQSGNTWKIGETPFTKADTANGYFPINTTVVTNGAGASYATKLWQTWE